LYNFCCTWFPVDILASEELYCHQKSPSDKQELLPGNDEAKDEPIRHFVRLECSKNLGVIRQVMLLSKGGLPRLRAK
jgi:hypothetical protein